MLTSVIFLPVGFSLGLVDPND